MLSQEFFYENAFSTQQTGDLLYKSRILHCETAFFLRPALYISAVSRITAAFSQYSLHICTSINQELRNSSVSAKCLEQERRSLCRQLANSSRFGRLAIRNAR